MLLLNECVYWLLINKYKYYSIIIIRSALGEITFGVGVNAVSHQFLRPLTVEIPFMAESSKWKRQFLLSNFMADSTRNSTCDTCLYDDAVTASKHEGKCVRHPSRSCHLPRTLCGLKAGFSCKTFSRMRLGCSCRLIFLLSVLLFFVVKVSFFVWLL